MYANGTVSSGNQFNGLLLPVNEQLNWHFLQVVAEECGTTFQCRVIGKPIPDITWYFEDKPIKSSKFFQISEEDDVCMLIIAEAYAEDAGKYSCHANNEAGEAVTSAVLLVQGGEFVKNCHQI